MFLWPLVSVRCILDVSPTAADDILDNLRSHIFVDSRYVFKGIRSSVCDSLAGPNCGQTGSAGLAAGVIPEEYIPGIDVDFSVLHQALPLDLWKFNYSNAVPPSNALPSISNLVLADLPGGGRITSQYSLTLPTGRGLAKLEGRWLLEDSVSMETYLPAYITFSEPVMVKQVLAELNNSRGIDPRSKSVVIIAFRLGTETVWTSEAIMEPGFTLDLTSRGSDGHGPLRACDKIVIFSTVRGLKIVSIEFENVDEQVLVPTVLLVPGKDGTLILKSERVDAGAIANRKIVSIKEAVQEGYKLEFPARPALKKGELLAELISRDRSAIVPIHQLYEALKRGDLQVPHELKKAILKHENDFKRMAQKSAERALKAVLSPEYAGESSLGASHESGTDEEKRVQGISDLFLAALMHL